MDFVIGIDSIPLEFNGKVMGRDQIVLPPYTLRFEFQDKNYAPVASEIPQSCWTKVDNVSSNQWDLTYVNTDWDYLAEKAGIYAPQYYESGYRYRIIRGGDTSGVTSMSAMFLNTRLYDTCLFNTENVTDMSDMFYGTQIEIVPPMNTSSCTDMKGMFRSARNLRIIHLLDTSNVTDMSSMFVDTVSLVTVPLLDTSSCTDMSFMFTGSGIQSVPLFNTENVVDMKYMFQGAASLLELPTFNTHNVNNMQGFCITAESLRNVPLFDVTSLEDISAAFAGCRNVEGGALALYNRAKLVVTDVDKYNGAFADCGIDTTTGAAELAQIPSDWKTISTGSNP